MLSLLFFFANVFCRHSVLVRYNMSGRTAPHNIRVITSYHISPAINLEFFFAISPGILEPFF